MAHSHDDVGWLKTLDQYFWGIHDDVQRANVLLIIDSVVTELEQNKDRKYTEVEMAFFMKWWEQQTDKKKESVKNLVKEGRLEVVNAGWSMNDEACPYYTQIIDNMLIGHKFLKEELGVTTNIGWHLDPFGHSAGNAALFADMGFDAFFYSRLDIQDKEKRLKEKSMEYIWRPFDQDKSTSTEIFTHAMFDHYYPPPGFCWATSTCAFYDEPIVADKKLKTFNYKERIEEIYEWVTHMKDHYRTKNLLVPLGGDFFYKNAHKIFINTDRLIKYFNEEYKDFELIYSTPSQYLKAVHAAKVKMPVKYGDQLPYSEKAFSYWTGFYSSRPVSKGNIRQLDRYVSSMNDQWTNTILNKKISKDIKKNLLSESQEALRIVGVMQHHDAVTGTERQHVADDYQLQMDTIINSTRAANTAAVKATLEAKFGKKVIKDVFHCDKEQDQFLTCPDHVFESLENSYFLFEKQHKETVLKVRLPHGNFRLIDPTTFFDVEGQSIHCHEGKDHCKLQVKNNNVGQLVYKLIHDDSTPYLHKNQACSRIWNSYQSIMITHMKPQEVTLWTVNCDTVREDPMFGDKSLCAERNITVDLRSYTSYEGDDQPSGAYVFRPANGTEDSDPYWSMEGYNCYKQNDDTFGSLEFKSDKGSITFTILKDDQLGIQVYTEFNGIEETDRGIEVTMNAKVWGMQTEGEFFTDSNGLQTQRRVLGERPDFSPKLEGTEHISANYYPINSAISIVDKERKDTFTVLNDRSQGGSSLKDGRIELMIDRRQTKDDYKGVEEALNETDSSGAPLKLHIHSIWLLEKNLTDFFENNGYSRLKLAQKRLQTNAEVTIGTKNANSNLVFTPREGLSSHPSIFTQVYPVALDEIILRVENTEDWFTSPQNEFTEFDVHAIAEEIYQAANPDTKVPKINLQETTLTAVETLKERESHRLTWKTEKAKKQPVIKKKDDALFRQEIRTYRVKYGSRFNGEQMIKE